MIIDESWRILTIGDGDLSFSLALQNHYQPNYLCATILDEVGEVEQKYGLANFNQLIRLKIPVIERLDVTDPASFSALPAQSFDLVIFQFPLIPSYQSLQQYKSRESGANSNILNRNLLHCFLRNSAAYFLDPNGQGLCYISSKDVKPYADWDLENGISQNTGMHFIGQSEFNMARFPGYLIRNVDRDKHVKHTQATTYVYALHPMHEIQSKLLPTKKKLPHYCPLCGVGPLLNGQDKSSHCLSKRHKKRAAYDEQWQTFLAKKYQ